MAPFVFTFMNRHFSGFHFNNAHSASENTCRWKSFGLCTGLLLSCNGVCQRSALFPIRYKEPRLFERLHVLAIGINSPYAHASFVQTNEQPLRSREQRRANGAVPLRPAVCFRLVVVHAFAVPWCSGTCLFTNQLGFRNRMLQQEASLDRRIRDWNIYLSFAYCVISFHDSIRTPPSIHYYWDTWWFP